VFEIGNSLREARVRQGLDFPELEQATKIRGKYLRALEHEEFEQLPGPTYVKGFLRSYADYLGLDGQLYVDEYNSRFLVGEDEAPFRPRRSTARRPEHRRIESNVILLALGGIALVTVLVIIAWKFGGSDGKQAIPDPRATVAGKPPAKRAKKPRPVHRTAVPAKAHLILKATGGDCWLEVHKTSANGKIVFSGTLQPDSRPLDFTAKRLWIIAGAPQNLTVKLNGNLRAFPRGDPSIVLVSPKGIARASAAA
jgi:cytoskeletal protein RodZ